MEEIEKLIEETEKKREEVIRNGNLQLAQIDGKLQGLRVALEMMKKKEAEQQ